MVKDINSTVILGDDVRESMWKVRGRVDYFSSVYSPPKSAPEAIWYDSGWFEVHSTGLII